MKALAVFMLLLGVVAMLHRPADITGNAAYQSVAVNYGIYRSAVFRYVAANRGHSGAIPQAALALPASWQALRVWRARVDAGRCYVYGEASHEEIATVRDMFRGSFALGMASNGRLVPALGSSAVPVPAWVPDGNLVSVTGVD